MNLPPETAKILPKLLKAAPAKQPSVNPSAKSNVPADTTEVPKDEVLIGGDEAPKTDGLDQHDPNPVEAQPKKKNPARRARKGFLTAASTVIGAAGAITSIPKGIQLGLDTKAGKSDEVKKLNAGRVNTFTSIATSAGVGMAVLGPVGLVVGGVVGYVTGTLSNHLASRSGTGDQQMKKISDAVTETVGESKGLWGSVKAAYRGGVEGLKEGFKSRKTTSKIQMSGMLDGASEAVDDWKHSTSEPIKELAPDSPHGAFKKTLMAAGGLLGGVAGVMINAPGGAVVGFMESLKETPNYVPTEMEKTVMLWATNVGKFLPAAIISAAFGGAVGIAASTAVGITTASLASIIDGRLGVNRKIARPVEKAVKEAHGEEDVKENLRAYHRAGKGSVVGFSAGIREGWKAGVQGGVEIVKGSMATLPESVDQEKSAEEADKKSE